MSRIHTAVPSYSELLLDRNDLSERNREHVLVVLTCLLEGRDPSDTELERSARNGERRALQGVSQVAVIQSFRTAAAALAEQDQRRGAPGRPVAARRPRRSCALTGERR
ncbi:hypothetical protein [Cellulomonas fengjieae]|uniref:hypothetical protein n=1 Tax=Cellulomonas fengjieae TaxID=2819978 RepID=UPI001AAFE1D8|nr:hypothetical protein [Cellulomonas fengjieae]MBO3103883.1 hypothetical protein [Cellulomonas fengjieae]